MELGGHLGGVTALEFQHEDKFLAVARWVLGRQGSDGCWLRVARAAATAAAAEPRRLPPSPLRRLLPPTPRSGGGSVVLYPDVHRAGAGGAAASAVPLRPTTDASARLCLSLAAAGDASAAAGTAAGGVAVWDVVSQQPRQQWDQHGGAAVHAIQFAPLKPALLYSAGADGRVVLQVRCRAVRQAGGSEGQQRASCRAAGWGTHAVLCLLTPGRTGARGRAPHLAWGRPPRR